MELPCAVATSTDLTERAEFAESQSPLRRVIMDDIESAEFLQ